VRVNTSGLVFDASAHRYTLAGVDLPSVTQVLESVGLIDYSHIPWPTRQMALERGRAVHEAIALDIEGDLDEESADEAGILGYVQAARSARQALAILVPTAWEERVYHPRWQYAGTLDLRDGNTIIDWKTNAAEYWVRFQLAAYAACVAQVDAKMNWTSWPIRRICAELHEDGSFAIFEFGIESLFDDLQTFLAALRIHREKTNPRSLR
jgi:hypothetical protein